MAAVRSPKTSTGLQDLKQKYPDALTIVALDSGVFSSVKVCILLCDPSAVSGRNLGLPSRSGYIKLVS